MTTRAMAKRGCDIALSAVGIVLLTPVWILVALAIRLGDGGSILFKQERIGRGGIPFRIWKFRTMVPDAQRLGLSVTAGHDPRITQIGRWLRRYKLDELPQLANVLCGDMSLVGPRPEVPRYVALYTPTQRRVLCYVPGVTDPASLEFRNEEELLAGAENVEKFYVEYCIPRKIELNLAYADRATLLGDMAIIARTLCSLLSSANRSHWTGLS